MKVAWVIEEHITFTPRHFYCELLNKLVFKRKVMSFITIVVVVTVIITSLHSMKGQH